MQQWLMMMIATEQIINSILVTVFVCVIISVFVIIMAIITDLKKRGIFNKVA